jgi:hypothetical protein
MKKGKILFKKFFFAFYGLDMELDSEPEPEHELFKSWNRNRKK